MKVLFFARHFTYLRNFESVLRLLADRGHQVHVAVGRDEAFGGREMVERLCRDYPGITAGSAPQRTDDWYRLATRLRLGLDYLRYLDPAYAPERAAEVTGVPAATIRRLAAELAEAAFAEHRSSLTGAGATHRACTGAYDRTTAVGSSPARTMALADRTGDPDQSGDQILHSDPGAGRGPHHAAPWCCGITGA